MIDADDFEEEADLASFVTRSLTRLWASERVERFDYTYRIATAEGRLYFLILLEGGDYLDFTHAAAVCDGVDAQLGPSLLTQLRLATPLTPAFTPEVARDFIATYHWEGFDDAENLLEMARNDLAYAHQVPGDSLSIEEVESYADSHYFTPRQVDRLIDRRYQHPGTLSLGECHELCRRHAFPNLTRVCELLVQLKVLSDTLPGRAELPYEMSDGYLPFAALLSVQREGAEHNLVNEIHREHEDSVWQNGEYDPIYALNITSEDPDSLLTLGRALSVAKRSLELTEALYQTLEVTTCLFP